MPSTITWHRSFLCKITTILLIVRRSVRCSPLSRSAAFLCTNMNNILTVTVVLIVVRCWRDSLVSACSWLPYSPSRSIHPTERVRWVGVVVCFILVARFETTFSRWLKYYATTPGGPEIVKRVQELAERKSVSMAQIATAWMMAKDGKYYCCCIPRSDWRLYLLGVTAPIVGTTSLKNLEDLISMFKAITVPSSTLMFSPIESVDVKLTEEDIKYLEEPYKTVAVFGHFWTLPTKQWCKPCCELHPSVCTLVWVVSAPYSGRCTIPLVTTRAIIIMIDALVYAAMRAELNQHVVSDPMLPSTMISTIPRCTWTSRTRRRAHRCQEFGIQTATRTLRLYTNKVSKKKGDHVGDSIVVITHSTKYWPHSKLTVSIFIKLLPVTPVIGVILSEWSHDEKKDQLMGKVTNEAPQDT